MGFSVPAIAPLGCRENRPSQDVGSGISGPRDSPRCPLRSAMSLLDFWFDFASSYSFPAAMRVGPLAAKAGVSIRFRPFLLAPIFKAQGWSTSPFNIYEAKGRNMWRDLERQCAAL